MTSPDAFAALTFAMPFSISGWILAILPAFCCARIANGKSADRRRMVTRGMRIAQGV